MRIVRTLGEMLALGREWRGRGDTVGFVPTMGYLHAGHTSLMALARPRTQRLVASIYVNPLQFGPNEDLARYPRDPEGDARACAQAGVDVLFMPDTLYPDGFATSVRVGRITERWEGAARPGHFDGVATVVARLFGIVQPTLAVFGEKDFQQLAVVRRMVEDLSLPVEIMGGPLVRDEDGLALSSRNVYLTPTQRMRARSLSHAMRVIQEMRGETVEARIAEGRRIVDADAVDYLAIVDARTLDPVASVQTDARAIVTARFGPVRLLDNAAVLA
jgi:pantoate--beta-alanine ligase